jgi:hypothetical protein
MKSVMSGSPWHETKALQQTLPDDTLKIGWQNL